MNKSCSVCKEKKGDNFACECNNIFCSFKCSLMHPCYMGAKPGEDVFDVFQILQQRLEYHKYAILYNMNTNNHVVFKTRDQNTTFVIFKDGIIDDLDYIHSWRPSDQFRVVIDTSDLCIVFHALIYQYNYHDELIYIAQDEEEKDRETLFKRHLINYESFVILHYPFEKDAEEDDVLLIITEPQGTQTKIAVVYLTENQNIDRVVKSDVHYRISGIEYDEMDDYIARIPLDKWYQLYERLYNYEGYV